MVVFDNNILCIALAPESAVWSVSGADQRVRFLVEELKKSKEPIVIPAPAWAEFLVFAGDDAPKYAAEVRSGSTFRIEPFDDRAAIEIADVEIKARKAGQKRGATIDSPWQKVKFDRQIAAIAKVHSARVVYSDDADVVAHSADFGLHAVRLADLPIPPQGTLFDNDG